MKKVCCCLILVVMAMVFAGCGNTDSVSVNSGGTVYVMDDPGSAYDMYLSWGTMLSPFAFTIVNTSEEDVVIKNVSIRFDSTNSALFVETARWFELREDLNQTFYGVADKATLTPSNAISVGLDGISIIPKKGMKKFRPVVSVWSAADQVRVMSWRASITSDGVKAFGLTSGKEMKVEGGASSGIIRMDSGGKG